MTPIDEEKRLARARGIKSTHLVCGNENVHVDHIWDDTRGIPWYCPGVAGNLVVVIKELVQRIEKLEEAVISRELDSQWEYSYVETLLGGDISNREIFATEEEAWKCLEENREEVARWNEEVTWLDRVTGSVEKRLVPEPGPWINVEE